MLFFPFFSLFLRNNNKSSSQQSSSSSSSSSLSSCSSSSALAQELSQQTAVIPESDSNSQVDWTYDPNEPRYCICNQVRMAPKLKYNYSCCFDVAELPSLNTNFEKIVLLLLNFWLVFILTGDVNNELLKLKIVNFLVMWYPWRVLNLVMENSGIIKLKNWGGSQWIYPI